MTDALCHLVVDGNEALDIKLVRKIQDIDDDNTSFAPEMCHQVFGDNENIFGYSDLRICLYYSAGSLQTYLGIEYTEKINPDDYDGLKADDIEKKLVEVLAPNYYTNIDSFTKSLSKDKKFTPYGSLEHSFNIPLPDGSGKQRKFEAYYCEASAPGFVSYHQRLQTFLLWYIDAASFIDIDDPQWTFFLVFEKYRTSEGDERYATVGYATVYRYYAYPNHVRPRISQVLVLPPFRRLGIAAQLLQTIYLHYQALPEVVDITVEGPSPEFQRIRDYVDADNCQHLPAFSPDNLHKGFSKEMVSQARAKLRLNKQQARRVYEILRLRHTNTSHPEHYLLYRLDVKNRLNAPYQRKKNDMKKLQKVLRPDDLMVAASTGGVEETRARLAGHYRALEDEYKQVLHRLEHK